MCPELLEVKRLHISILYPNKEELFQGEYDATTYIIKPVLHIVLPPMNRCLAVHQKAKQDHLRTIP